MQSERKENLGDFAESGLTTLLAHEFCGPCDYEEDCNDCPGWKLFEEMENQVGQLGVEYMKSLVNEWVKANGTIC